MKTKILLPFACFFASSMCHAAIVDSISARNVATNFYNNNSFIKATTLNLTFTEKAEDGSAAYYVFNINSNDGFVIISADDVALPILAYSTTGNYDVSNIAPALIRWMENIKQQISYIKTNKLIATQEIIEKWKYYQIKHNKSKERAMSSVGPLLTTTWNQSPYYNDLCPGGSVTGCVATAMAQVMKYWNYPAKGRGSHSYCDCTSNNFHQNYGTLTADYDTTNYYWTNMPNNLTAANNDVAILMYDCGVSVDMDYSPSQSWAAFNPMVNAFTNYFRYDSSTINFAVRNNSDSIWINVLETELNKHHPIIYNLSGVHSWVCDGYDANNYLHMNWGWGGSGNGYYILADTIYISNGYTFWGGNSAYSAILGIQPSGAAGIQSYILPPNKITLYPNPAIDQVTFNAPSLRTNEAAIISVTNVLGEIIQEEKVKWSIDESININTLPSGIYLVQVTNDSGKWTGKFVKE